LLVHGKGPSTADINRIFAALKLKKTQCSMWKSIIGAWLNVRVGLTKTNPTSSAEILRQPLFGNPLIFDSNGTPLGTSGLREGNAFAHYGYSRVKDLWNEANNDWKSLT
jgi:hypothetical protein